MYSIIIKWTPGWKMSPGADKDRYSSILGPERAARFKEFVDAGLVSNSAGPNCYIKTVGDSVEYCNATWQTLEAAQEWANLTKNLPTVASLQLLDESGNILDSYPE